jgi:adenylate kinase
MIVAITGTPGTGTREVAKELKNYPVINLDEYAKNFVVGHDEERDCDIVDMDRLNDFINGLDGNFIFIEGHLSHLLKCASKIIVLRRSPRELEKELINRNWSKKKIDENVEAEILDIILCESSAIHGEENIWEIDTTNKDAKDVAEEIEKIMSNGFRSDGRVGIVDWTNYLC